MFIFGRSSFATGTLRGKTKNFQLRLAKKNIGSHKSVDLVAAMARKYSVLFKRLFFDVKKKKHTLRMYFIGAKDS